MSPVHDYVIDNSTGANVRSDINNVLQAILTNNSSSSAPSTTAAYMWWADTTNGVLKIRNSSNNDWVELLQLDGTLTLEDGSASTPGLAFRDDLNTGIFSSAADTFNVATAGVERMELGATTIFNESGADVDFRIEGDTDANLFYVDAGNDRVGIGRSDPQTTFHSTGTTNGQQATFGASSAGLKISTFAKTNNDAGVILDAQQSSNGTLTFATTSSERMRIDSSGELQFTSTDQIFRLNTSDGSDNKRFIITGGGASGQNRGGQVVIHGNEYSSAGGKIQLLAGNASTDGTVDFFTGGSERMRIDSSGHVGIGTTSPQCNLHVHQGDSGSVFAKFTNSTTTIGSSNGFDVGLNSSEQGFLHVRENKPLLFQINGSERMRIDSSGRLNIGTTLGDSTMSSLAGLVNIHTTNTGTHNGLTLFWDHNNQTTNIEQRIQFSLGDDASDDNYQNAGYIGIGKADTWQGNSNRSSYLSFATSNAATQAERMRIDSDGDVLLGTSNWTTSSGGLLINITSDPVAQLHFSRPSSFTASQNVILNYHNGTYIGGINTSTTATSFPTSSDYRLKENVIAMSDGITRLKTLKPYKFNFKLEPSKTVDGFFAHEVSSVVPDAVFGEKDGEQMQGLDHSKLVPLLVAAVQELITKVETLEAA